MANPGQDGCSRMVAAAFGSVIQLWQISDNGQSTREIGECYCDCYEIWLDDRSMALCFHLYLGEWLLLFMKYGWTDRSMVLCFHLYPGE